MPLVCLLQLRLVSIWPPPGIDVNPWEVPLLNTVILLVSGATCTWAHDAMICGDRQGVLAGLALTICLGLCLRLYKELSILMLISLYQMVYRFNFFLATGFHGFHVLVGSTFLVVCLIRAYNVTLHDNIILVLKPLHGIGILLTLYGYSYLFRYIGGVVFKV